MLFAGSCVARILRSRSFHAIFSHFDWGMKSSPSHSKQNANRSMSPTKKPIFESNKNLPFRAKVPYDVSSGWPLHLTYAFQVLSTFFLISHILFMDHNGQACMNECCLHLSILANELQTLDQNQATKSTKKRSMDSLASKQQLLSCIERHREMIM